MGSKAGASISLIRLNGASVEIRLSYSQPHPATGEYFPADPEFIEVRVRKPSGDELTFKYGFGQDTITRLGQGEYLVSFTPTEPGAYRYIIKTNGGGGPGESGEFTTTLG